MRLIQCAVFLAALAMAGCGGVAGGPGALPSDFSLLPSQDGQYYLQANTSGGATATAALFDAKGTEIKRATMPVTTDYDGSGQAEASLDLATVLPGRYAMKVYYTDDNGASSDAITKNCSVSGGLRTASRYEGPSNLGDTAVGDLNGDGRNDVAVIEAFNNSGAIEIYYGNAAGTLETHKTHKVSFSTTAIAIADVNHDGRADVVVAGVAKTPEGETQGRVAVLLQDPSSGELLPAQEYEMRSEEVAGLAVADVNGDGRNDIVVGAPGGGVAIFFQNSDGTLASEVICNKAKPVSGSALRIADMDGDGRNDIVLQSAEKELAVMRQIAPGVFSPPQLYAVETSSLPVVLFEVGDVDGDGRADIVTVDPVSSRFTLFTQNRDGKLDRSTLEQPASARGVRVADITGDGLNDLVFRVYGGVTVLPQQPDHSFGPELSYAFPLIGNDSSTSQGMSVATMTGDSRLDVFTTCYDKGLYHFVYTAQFLTP